jgi:hypothetical protein
VSFEELFNELEGTLDTPRDSIAGFEDSLLIMPKTIERISLKVDVPMMLFIGRHHALIQFILATSEGDLSSEQIYVSTEEL